MDSYLPDSYIVHTVHNYIHTTEGAGSQGGVIPPPKRKSPNRTIESYALVSELPQYLAAAASAPVFDRTVGAYTEALLLWWRTNHPRFPAWAEAARIASALTCTSAASERVFSLVESMFGEDQVSSLAD